MQAEIRGRDSTGVAIRTLDDMGKPSNLCYRQVVPARTFAELHKKFMGDARRAVRGIAHTRRASPGMPIDNANAHPYVYPYGSMGKYFFAHNGRVQNWEPLRTELKDNFQRECASATSALAARLGAEPTDLTLLLSAAVSPNGNLTPAQIELQARSVELKEEWSTAVAAYARERYMEVATTDSMVLGPCVEQRDFSKIVGCLGLVWMRAGNAYVLRAAKEAVGANIIWKYRVKQDGEPEDDQVVTVVASTPEIIADGIEKIVDSIEVDYSFIPIEEAHVYRIEPTGLVDEGRVPVQAAVEDEFSSAAVEDKNGVPLGAD